MNKPRVIIIGAGIGGLATANLLARDGYEVHIYEKLSQAGGRAGQLKENGFTFDTGPSWYLMPEAFERFFSLIGENIHDHLSLKRLSPAYQVYFQDEIRPITIYADALKDRATFEAFEPGAGRALDTYLAEAEQTYNLATKHFLYTNFSDFRQFLQKDVLKHTVRLGKAALLPIDKHTKRYVRDQRLRQILEYPMVFLGTSPFEAPALYSLMSHMDFTQGVYYPEGGLYTIIEALENLAYKAGVTIHYNSPVFRIETANGKASGVITNTGLQEADIIISNADLHFTETQLLPKAMRQYKDTFWKRAKPSPSAILMYLGVKGSLPELQHHNLFFAKNWKQNFTDIFTNKQWPAYASLYICKPSATDPSVAPRGHENLFVLVPGPSGTSETKASVEEHARRYIDQIAQDIRVPDLATRIVYKKFFGPQDFESVYNSWQGNALGLSHTLSQSAFFRPSNQHKKLKNFYYVGGNINPGVGLPMCLIGAENLLKRIQAKTPPLTPAQEEQ